MPSDMPPTPESTPARRRFRWRTVLLVVSLGFNLLIIGAVAGTMLGHDDKGPRRGKANPLLSGIGHGPFVGALSSDDKRDMTEALREQAGSFRTRRRELRSEFETLLDILRAEELNEAELKDAFARQRARVSDVQELGAELLLQRILAMTPEERMAYAGRLDQQLRHRGPDPRKKRD